MYTLRPHQSKAIADISDAFRRGHIAPLHYAPTGSGKTVTFAELTRLCAVKGTSICVMAHRRELVNQIRRTLQWAGVEHDVIAPGHPFRGLPVAVASKDTMRNRPDLRYDLLIIDEAHHAVARTYRDIIARCRWTLGVTATPFRMSGAGMGDVFDALVPGPHYSDLTPQYLSPYKMFAPPCRVSLKGLKSRGGDYRIEEAEKLLNSRTITGDAVQHYAQHLNGAPTIVFCTTVQHARDVADQFRAEGWRAESVDGGLPDEVRDERIAGLGNGQLNLLTSCELIGEGVDIPVVSGAIFLRVTRSLCVWMQQAGRALRAAPGKDLAILLDHVGNVWRNGPIDARHEWTLEKGVVRPPKEKEVRERICQCPACYYVHEPAKECPACGHVYAPARRPTLRVVNGRLEEVTEADKNKAIKMAKTQEELLALANKRGYKPGWVWHVRNARAAKHKEYKCGSRR